MELRTARSRRPVSLSRLTARCRTCVAWAEMRPLSLSCRTKALAARCPSVPAVSVGPFTSVEARPLSSSVSCLVGRGCTKMRWLLRRPFCTSAAGGGGGGGQPSTTHRTKAAGLVTTADTAPDTAKEQERMLHRMRLGRSSTVR